MLTNPPPADDAKRMDVTQWKITAKLPLEKNAVILCEGE